jgi:hypothetical protein
VQAIKEHKVDYAVLGVTVGLKSRCNFKLHNFKVKMVDCNRLFLIC